MTLRFAFNTNGAAHHRLDDALTLIAEAGYDGVALTLDVPHLDPFDPDFLLTVRHVAARLRALSLGCVVDTGAPFLLNPRAHHEPTLVSADPDGRALRLDLLSRALQVTAETGGEAMRFWSGTPEPGTDPAQAHTWLLEGLTEIVRLAETIGVTAALQPQPGMAIGTLEAWRALDIPGLKLALNGHEPTAVQTFANDLATVTIEDMTPGGEDIPGLLGALRAIAFQKLICVELPRDSQHADTTIPQTLAALRAA